MGKLHTHCENGHDLSKTRFYKRGKAKGCVVCKNAREKKWHEAHPGRNAAKSKRWRSNHTELDKAITRNGFLKKKYGITTEQYEAILVSQDYVCAICKGVEPRKGARLAVDHCHATGKVRGLLCTMCNTSIGLLRDSPGLVAELLNYMRKHSQLELSPSVKG